MLYALHIRFTYAPKASATEIVSSVSHSHDTQHNELRTFLQRPNFSPVNTPNYTLRVPVYGIVMCLGYRRFLGVFLYSSEDAVERLLLLRALGKHIRLPMGGISSEQLDVNLVVTVFVGYISTTISCQSLSCSICEYDVPMRITAVTAPATSGAMTSMVTFP